MLPDNPAGNQAFLHQPFSIISEIPNRKSYHQTYRIFSHDFVEPLRASVLRIYPKAAPGSPVSALKLRAFGCEAMDSESYSHQSKGNKVLKLPGHQSRDHRLSIYILNF